MMIATQFMSFGVPFEDCLPRMTANPARILGRPELGRLEVGGAGDLTILKVERGDFAVTDVDGRVRRTNQRVVALGAVRAAQIIPFDLPVDR